MLLKTMPFLLLFVAFSFKVKGNNTTDSTTISILLKSKQATALMYYDNNYKNRKLIFRNLSDTLTLIKQKILLNKSTEFIHSTLRSVLGKPLTVDQRFFVESGSTSSWILMDDYKLINNNSSGSQNLIEDIEPISMSIKDDFNMTTKIQLINYLQEIKNNYVQSNEKYLLLSQQKRITNLQLKNWQIDSESRYFLRFFKCINESGDLSHMMNNEINTEISRFNSKIDTFQQIRSSGMMNTAFSILYYLSKQNYRENFNIATQYALINLKEVAVPTLLGVMKMIPEIGNAKYKKSIDSIRISANPVQVHFLEALISNSITNSEKYLLATSNKIGHKTLKSILDENKGKFILIDFWASWCIPCRTETPFLLRKQQKFQSKDIVFIGISLDEDDKEKEWINALKIDKQYSNSNQYRLVNPKRSTLLSYFNLQSIPKYVLLNPEGKILNKNFVRPSEDDFEKMIDSYLNSF